MNYKHKQAGGTILGIIIGLIIGLAIAVVVAVTITKTPISFVDRGMKADKGSNGASQLPDLNKSLYGNREPAKQAAKEFQKDAEVTVTTDPASAAAAAPAKPDAKVPVVDKSTAAVAAAKPKAAEAKPADGKESAKEAAAGEEKWIYYLQAGAFREQADAENAKAKLALLGIEARITERPSDDGSVLYRVRIGPLAQVDAMNKVRSKLSENGVDVAVVRIPK